MSRLIFQILDRKNAEIEDVKTQYRAKAKEMEDTVNKLEKKSKLIVLILLVVFCPEESAQHICCIY